MLISHQLFVQSNKIRECRLIYFYLGFADKGRLGIGSLSDWNPQNPFVNTPYLIEGLSKVFIKKVYVH